ncbi:hypothetical protein EV421DRAFT_1908383 [Armillaria borealis]|uniref:Uncharacterized protein n=1 Tax=Armillaria borealis TaxID=47425 RepID=A0AA39J5U3_9AGAR|nr:hypothetical protein EV421DRAFT_1908383 [Armillaria borealis]
MSSARPGPVVVDGLVDSVTLVTLPVNLYHDHLVGCSSVSFHLFKIQYEYQAFSVSGPASDDNEWDILKWLPLSFKLAPGTRSGDSRFGSKV